MTNYVPDYKKKIRILEKRERELHHALKNEFSIQKIAAVAEKVRIAKLNMYKARLAQIPPADGRWERREKLWKAKSEQWQSHTLEEIVRRYAKDA